MIERHSPDVLAVEDTFIAVKRCRCMLKLGQVRGTMLLLAEQWGLNCQYAPAGRRQADQSLVMGTPKKARSLQMVKCC